MYNFSKVSGSDMSYRARVWCIYLAHVACNLSEQKECVQRIQDVAGLAQAQLPKDIGKDLIRHFNAAHIAGYVGLNGVG